MSGAVDPFQVRVGEFAGPLDLLLHLVRQHEVEVEDLPLSRITSEYVETLKFMEQIDLEPASEFLEVAATLVRMKARALLPSPSVATGDEEAAVEEAALLQQLVEHQVVRMAAERLRAHEARAAAVWFRGERPREDDGGDPEPEIVEADLFSLVTAFKRLMEDLEPPPALEVAREDFTVTRMADAIRARLGEDEPVRFEQLFERGDPRAKLIATFLALLELIRNQEVRAFQDGARGPILIFPLQALPAAEAPDSSRRPAVEAVPEPEPETPDPEASE